MMHVFTPSSPLGAKCMESPLLVRRMGSESEEVCSYGNLSSTLKKLCMWERKLYHEVKV